MGSSKEFFFQPNEIKDSLVLGQRLITMGTTSLSVDTTSARSRSPMHTSTMVCRSLCISAFNSGGSACACATSMLTIRSKTPLPMLAPMLPALIASELVRLACSGRSTSMGSSPSRSGSRYMLRKGWFRASSMVIRFAGLNTSSVEIRSKAASEAVGHHCFQSIGGWLSFLMNARTRFWFSGKKMSSSAGVPSIWMISCTMCKAWRPMNKAFRHSSSPRMVPQDHISIGFE
mmetsp:Transcript_17924/g.31827  ORF Transcript_17924/g.31827 Transcript_17924/m.31827 type:complete len:231 (-) Transcript_17924:934-1626(-)